MLLSGLLLALLALVGVVVGSFLNVCIDRLPGGKSIINPPSACASCNRRLSIRDLVPLFSYLWLRGRCRYCGTPIPRRLPAVELAMGIIFPLLYWQQGLTLVLGFSLVYASVLAVIFVIDIEHQLILDKVVFPMMVLALAFAVFNPVLGINAGWRLISSVSGGAVGLVIMLIPFLVSRGGMGFGDVKMAALMGLITGFPKVFIALFLSITLGGLVAVVLLTLGIKKRREAIPFGPFLVIGTMVVMVWGSEIQQWYQSLPS